MRVRRVERVERRERRSATAALARREGAGFPAPGNGLASPTRSEGALIRQCLVRRIAAGTTGGVLAVSQVGGGGLARIALGGVRGGLSLGLGRAS